MTPERVRVVVVTGLSGAGKSTALHSLEDLGYFCVDNLPPSLLERTVEVCEEGGIRRIGIGIDVRVGSFLDGAVDALSSLDARRDVSVVFLDASDEALIRRFSETRRPHPLTSSAAREGRTGAVAVLDGVQIERERLGALRANAAFVIDTTLLSVHDLRRQVVATLGPGKAAQPRMVTRFVSFGFKYGLPVDADVVLDVRMLENPFFVPALRHLPGTDPKVASFVLENPETVELVQRAMDLLAYAVPRYEREGKSYLTIGVGCTGGRHRSVAVASELAERLRKALREPPASLRKGPASSEDKALELPILVLHRDVGRADILGAPSSVRRDEPGGPK